MAKRRSSDNKVFTLFCIAIAAAISLTACGQTSEAPSPEQQSADDKKEFEEAPGKLVKIETNIERIF